MDFNVCDYKVGFPKYSHNCVQGQTVTKIFGHFPCTLDLACLNLLLPGFVQIFEKLK